MKALKDFYHNKKVFITGNTGFKGSWLSFWLLSMGAEVMGYSLESPPLSNYVLLGLDNHMHTIYSDIRNSQKLEEAILSFKPDIILHLAAQPLVKQSYLYPQETFGVNIQGTVNLLHSVLTLSKSFPKNLSTVIITTDKCYQNKEWLYGYRENDTLGGYDPYSASKACCELITDSYRQSFFSGIGLGVASARAGNVIGGGDFSQDRLIPDIVRAYKNKQNIVLRNPGAIRPWQHVLDPLSGYLILAMSLYNGVTEASGAFNFGPDFENGLSVLELSKRFACMIGFQGEIHCRYEASSFHETSQLWLDSTKSRKLLCWNPRFSIQEALDMTAKWYLAFISGADLCDITSKQIAVYEKTKGEQL